MYLVVVVGAVDNVENYGIRVAVKKCTPGATKLYTLLSTGGKHCAQVVEKMYPAVDRKLNPQLMHTFMHN